MRAHFGSSATGAERLPLSVCDIRPLLEKPGTWNRDFHGQIHIFEIRGHSWINIELEQFGDSMEYVSPRGGGGRFAR
jgi:hypothetical protein